jgi:porin
MNKIKFAFLVAWTPLTLFVPAAESCAAEPVPIAQSTPQAADGKLTGGWGGLRNKLAAQGATFEAYYTGDIVTNIGGGIANRTTYIGIVSIGLNLDLEKLLGQTGWSFRTSAIAIHGQGPSAITGDFQWTSNIEADATSRLYDAWLQKSFSGGNTSVLFGLYDWNSENNITDSSLVFLNNSFGVGAELSQFPVNGGVMVSTYPTAALGARFLTQNAGVYLNASVLGGLSGNYQNPNGNTFNLKAEDGLFLATEVGYKTPDDIARGRPGKYAFGSWMFTKRIPTIDKTGTDANYGFYFLGEQALSTRLSLFARFGTASGVNQVHSNLAAGVTLKGIHSSFGTDQLGFGVTTAWNSNEYMAAQEAAGNPSELSETAVELLYRFEMLPGVAVQPDLQYVFNPGMARGVSDTLNFFIRFDLSL